MCCATFPESAELVSGAAGRALRFQTYAIPSLLGAVLKMQYSRTPVFTQTLSTLLLQHLLEVVPGVRTLRVRDLLWRSLRDN